MRRSVLKRWATMLLAFALVLSPVAAQASSGGSVIPETEKIDIFINAGDGYGMNPDDFAEKLTAKLVELSQDPQYETITADQVRIKSNQTAIDTTNLDNWYVYDHYNAEAWEKIVVDNAAYNGLSIQDAWKKEYGMSSYNNVKRPAYFIQDYNAGSSLSTYHISDVIGNASALGKAQRLQEHIYSYSDNGKPAMWFLGYGSNSVADFLFYPATSTGAKTIKFQVDSQYVNTHAMLGAGFLLNTGINAKGEISGYLLFYQFSASTSVSEMTLYKIKSGVKASELHSFAIPETNIATGTVTILDCAYVQAIDRLTALCDVVADGTVSSPSWASTMEIQIDVTPNSVSVRQQSATAPGELSETTPVLSLTGLQATGYNGFGPFVQYQGYGHNCSDGSAFKFSELEMGFVRSNNSVLDALAYSDYLRDSEKYFINLLSADKGSDAVADGDWDGIARLYASKIHYLTNVENPFLNDGDGDPGTTAPHGSNGVTYSADDYNVVGTDIDEQMKAAKYDALITEIATYILTQKTWEVVDPADLENTTPVAIFDFVANEGGVDTQVKRVHHSYLPAGGLDIFAVDSSNAGVSISGGVSTPYSITKRVYVITSPDGSQETVTVTDPAALAAKRDKLITLTSDSELGYYTVELTVYNDNDDPNTNFSQKLEKTFLLTADETPPSITADVSGGVLDASFEDGGALDEGITGYLISYQAPQSDYDFDANPNAVGYTAVNPPVSSLTIDSYQLPKGDYYVYVTAFDAAGNSQTERIHVDNSDAVTVGDTESGQDITVELDATVVEMQGTSSIANVPVPSVVVKDGSTTLVEGVDYTVEYYYSGTDLAAEVTMIGQRSGSGTVTKPLADLGIADTSVGTYSVEIVSSDPTGKIPAGFQTNIDYTSIDPQLVNELLGGYHVKVWLDVNVVEDYSVPKPDRDLINFTREENESVAVYLDIMAWIDVDGYVSQVPELFGQVGITFALPSGAKPASGSYENYVYVVHNGALSILEDENADPNLVTFHSNQYSTYAVTYKVQGSNSTYVPYIPVRPNPPVNPGDGTTTPDPEDGAATTPDGEDGDPEPATDPDDTEVDGQDPTGSIDDDDLNFPKTGTQRSAQTPYGLLLLWFAAALLYTLLYKRYRAVKSR